MIAGNGSRTIPGGEQRPAAASSGEELGAVMPCRSDEECGVKDSNEGEKL